MNKHTELNRRLADLMRSAQDGDGSAYVRLPREISPLIRRGGRGRGEFPQNADIEESLYG